MALIRYRVQNFNLERSERILQINSILKEYKQRVSVRQLYYRLVAGGFIPNVPEEYDKVQNLVTDARYAGLIDWDAIEDRNREPVRHDEWDAGATALNERAEEFRLDRWSTQPFYVELWVEKAALSGILWPIALDYHITLMVNRGYSSASAMKESAERINFRSEATKDRDAKRPVILYLGDHDPSGEDMVRDVKDRLLEFGCPGWLDVRKVGLNMDQVNKYKPPPNPVKFNVSGKGKGHDARAADYIAKYGNECWEVDALPPPVLDLLVRTTINAYIDKPAMEKVIARETLIKNQIKAFAASFTEPK